MRARGAVAPNLPDRSRCACSRKLQTVTGALGLPRRWRGAPPRRHQRSYNERIQRRPVLVLFLEDENSLATLASDSHPPLPRTPLAPLCRPRRLRPRRRRPRRVRALWQTHVSSHFISHFSKFELRSELPLTMFEIGQNFLPPIASDRCGCPTPVPPRRTCLLISAVTRVSRAQPPASHHHARD